MKSTIMNQTSLLSKLRSDQGAIAFVWSVWLVLMAAALYVLARAGRTFLLNEDWWLVPPLTGNEPNLAGWLWTQNSEHLIPVPKVILLVLLKLTGGDFRVGMLFNILVLGALAMAMVYVARKVRGGQTSFVDAFFPIILLHLGNAENMYWCWQVTQVVPTALTCVILLVLIVSPRLDTPKAALIGGISLILLPLSGSHALPFALSLSLWLGYCGILHWLTSKTGDKPRWISIFLIGSAIISLAITGIYVATYQRPGWLPPDPTIGAAIETTLKFLTLGLGPAVRDAWAIPVALTVVFLGTSGLIVLLAVFRHRGQEQHRALGLLIFLGTMGLLALITGWGRATAIETVYGHQYPLRYVFMAAPVFLVAFFIWEIYGSARYQTAVLAGLFGVMVVLIPSNTLQGLGWVYWFPEKDRALEQDLQAGEPALVLAERYRELLLHWVEPEQIAGYMRMFRDAGIGPFAGLAEDPVIVAETTQPVSLPAAINDGPLVTQEIRYELAEAEGVYLVWGLNGWQVAPEALRPAGTEVKDNLMKTPMSQQGDLFTARLQIPAGTRLDYGFQVTGKKDAFEITWPAWDGDYQEIPLEDKVIEIEPKLSLTLISQEIRYRMREAGEVYLVWGLNGWHPAPEALRPAGTEVKDNVMQTLMTQEGNLFSTTVQVPAGTTINYGFRITDRRGLLDLVHPIWDGDYQETPLETGIIRRRGAFPLANNLSNIIDNAPYFLMGLVSLVVIWPILYFVLGLTKSSGLLVLQRNVGEKITKKRKAC